MPDLPAQAKTICSLLQDRYPLWPVSWLALRLLIRFRIVRGVHIRLKVKLAIYYKKISVRKYFP
jgi:hypothetical protein